MIKHMDARQVRERFAQLLGEVHDDGQTVIVDRSGTPMVAIIPLKEYQQLVSEREARFQILDDIRRRMPDLPVKEVEDDVAQAIAAVRGGETDAAGRP
jgi:prevent-host-death family protein